MNSGFSHLAEVTCCYHHHPLPLCVLVFLSLGQLRNLWSSGSLCYVESITEVLSGYLPLGVKDLHSRPSSMGTF